MVTLGTQDLILLCCDFYCIVNMTIVEMPFTSKNATYVMVLSPFAGPFHIFFSTSQTYQMKYGLYFLVTLNPHISFKTLLISGLLRCCCWNRCGCCFFVPLIFLVPLLPVVISLVSTSCSGRRACSYCSNFCSDVGYVGTEGGAPENVTVQRYSNFGVTSASLAVEYRRNISK